jgi:hypothetical protein
MRFATQSDTRATSCCGRDIEPDVDREKEALSAEPEVFTAALTATLNPAWSPPPLEAAEVTGGLK